MTNRWRNRCCPFPPETGYRDAAERGIESVSELPNSEFVTMKS
jgi:hypothetical protein